MVVKELLQSLTHPDEISALFAVRAKVKATPTPAERYPDDADLAYCFEMLSKVSRSFAIVIQELGDELRTAVCVFYLVLRALDTIEDDTSVVASTRVAHMLGFCNNMGQPGWRFSAGAGDEKALLENYFRVINVYRALAPEYQDIIRDITYRMSNGMSEFAMRPVVTQADYDKYCHYVAGLVGFGLTRLFIASGTEEITFTKHIESLANSMGLFLQKTNIIRDYLEDLLDNRTFWPREVWQQYAKKLGDFAEPEHLDAGLACLNHLVTDALEHVPACIEYMAALKEQHNFNFCAIPQVMAASTLALVYNNPRVFSGVVKMRRGTTCKYMLTTKSLNDVCVIFYINISSIRDQIPPNDPNAARTAASCAKILALLNEAYVVGDDGRTIGDAAAASSGSFLSNTTVQLSIAASAVALGGVLYYRHSQRSMYV